MADTLTSERKPYRVLSIDGGGMRGLYTATYLDRLLTMSAEKRKVAPIDFGAAFDLIVGTSTGAIIGLALAAGVPLSEVSALYESWGSRIFRRKMPDSLSSLLRDFLPRKRALAEGAVELRQVLSNTFGEMRLGDILSQREIAVAIPAVDMGRHRSWVFKTAHLPGSNGRDNDYSIVDVCMATSAAPLYRSLAAIPDPIDAGSYDVFVDGGLWANNPILVGLIDALDMTRDDDAIEIYSLGTCARPAGEVIARSGIAWSWKEWKFGGAITPVAIDAQEFAFDEMAQKLARHVRRVCSIVRFPTQEVPATYMQYLSLDETTSVGLQALKQLARRDVDMTNSRLTNPNDRRDELLRHLLMTAPSRIEVNHV